MTKEGIALFAIPSFCLDSLYALNRHLVYQRCSCRDEVKEGGGEGEQHGDREGHLSHEPEEVDCQPYLESDGKKSCYHADSCLQEECLVAAYCCDVCAGKHYQQHQERHLFVVSDEFFRSVRADDGSESAEEHCGYKRCG